MTFLQIMREAYLMRRAGCSAAVAIMSACESDNKAELDLHWNIVFERLMSLARIERSMRDRGKGRR